MARIKTILQEIKDRAEKEDMEWGEWIQNPENILAILKDPELAIQPSKRDFESKLKQVLNNCK